MFVNTNYYKCGYPNFTRCSPNQCNDGYNCSSLGSGFDFQLPEVCNYLHLGTSN